MSTSNATNKELTLFEEYERPGVIGAIVYRAQVSENGEGYCVVTEGGLRSNMITNGYTHQADSISEAEAIMGVKLEQKMRFNNDYSLVKLIDNVNDFLAAKRSGSKVKTARKPAPDFVIPTPTIESNLSAWL